jgi:hypothetical protein
VNFSGHARNNSADPEPRQPARADQRGDGVVDIRDAIGRFGRSLVAADGGFTGQMASI